jgi:hypothetical protein
MGSLILCLPSPFTGGELVITHNDETSVFDFAKQTSTGNVAWTFLYPDSDHEVLPVTSGTRVTLAYDIFFADEETIPRPVDSRMSSLSTALKNVIYSKETWSKPDGVVGIGLLHGYTAANDMSSDDFHKQLPGLLKGADRLIYDLVREMGLTWEFNAIFTLDERVMKEIDGGLEDTVRPHLFVLFTRSSGKGSHPTGRRSGKDVRYPRLLPLRRRR